MTVPQLAPALGAPTPAAAVTALRARGLRASTARRALLAALFEAEAPLTAEEVASSTTPPSDLASVYRNLETLEANGLVRHIHLGHGPGRYLPAAATDEFVACERCGAFERVAPAVLDAVRVAVRGAVGYSIRCSHFPLAGLCPTCDEACR